MKESVIYQDILQQGIERGLKQGIERGIEQALKTSIFDVLESRFNAIPPEVNSRLEGVTPEQLRGLLRLASTCPDLDDFLCHLTDSNSQ